MGMMACYMEAEHELIDRLMQLSDEDIFEECEALLENNKSYDMDKLWDGLHFILTGTSASTPIEDDLLSEAIVGTSMFSDDEDADFIAYIYPDRLKEILTELDKFDISNALNEFSPRVLARNHIYPNIWHEVYKDDLKNSLIESFNELREFYHSICDLHKGVIVSIY